MMDNGERTNKQSREIVDGDKLMKAKRADLRFNVTLDKGGKRHVEIIKSEELVISATSKDNKENL